MFARLLRISTICCMMQRCKFEDRGFLSKSLRTVKPWCVAPSTITSNVPLANSLQILQHLQGQATEATLNLTYMSYKEAIIMRIITIVTLVFLPATFVSVRKSHQSSHTRLNALQTFFSTDVIKFQTDNGNASFSEQALFRWLEVTLPLSVITLGVGMGWYRYQTKKSSATAILPM